MHITSVGFFKFLPSEVHNTETNNIEILYHIVLHLPVEQKHLDYYIHYNL